MKAQAGAGSADPILVKPPTAWWAVFVFTIISTINYLDRQVMTLMITPIKQDLGLSDTQVSLLIGFMFVIFYLAVGIPVSRLVDRGPRKWLLGAGVAFWSVMTACCGLASNFWQMAIARMGVGVGESCNTPAVFSMLSDMFPRDKLAAATSAVGLGVSFGSGIALFVGGVLLVWLTDLGHTTWPLVGTLAPWQMTFILVSLPGIFVAILTLATVPEPPRRGEAGRTIDVPKMGQVLRYMAQWRGAFVPIVIGIGVKAMLSFGTSVWGPSLFERKFGWEPGTPGLYMGMVYLIAAPIGTMTGGLLADHLARRGDKAAYMRVVLWASFGVLPGAVLFPLMPTGALSLFFLGVSLFFGAMGAGPGNAAVQIISPGRMRGTIVALYFALFNVMGYGLGPLVVARITEVGFGDPNMLPMAICITAAALGPLGILFSWMAIRPYVAAADALDAATARRSRSGSD